MPTARRPADQPCRDPTRVVVGLQPVREALRVHRQQVLKVALEDRGSARLCALSRFAQDQGAAKVERVPRRVLDRLSAGVSHQGAAAWVPALKFVPWVDALAAGDLLAVALSKIQDPQNFGAVIRSAVVMAQAHVIWGEHSSAPLSLATFRSSAGAIEHARLCRVASLAGALQEATACGIQVIGLDARAPVELRQLDLRTPTVVVVGSEHEGLQRAVRRSCSALASLVAPGLVESLNASVAAAVALYEARNQRSISSP